MSLQFRDRDGRPISPDDWVRLSNNAEYRQVGLTLVFSRKTLVSKVISTVWLGAPTSLPSGDFETAVTTEGFVTHLPLAMYRTRIQAWDGHWRIVRMTLEETADSVAFDDKRLAPVVIEGTVTAPTRALAAGPQLHGRQPAR